ncbi:Protein SRG1 -like protein [Gossypium arboreum]|uniref:Protein SRG1-like protein n=1 Tax=Gossypium arboreum TaxID=29729 RepID=A0A0B0NBY3_GOSAR|nr:Protein SRG1 -like protein [Gossypium arboreum]
MRFLRQWDAENLFIHFFWEGLNSMQSLIPCPILPQPKQKIGNLSYLKEIHDLELLSRETKMPLRPFPSPFLVSVGHLPLVLLW